MSEADEITKLVALRDAGEITAEEFLAAKARIFTNNASTSTASQRATSLLKQVGNEKRTQTSTLYRWLVVAFVLLVVTAGLIFGGVFNGASPAYKAGWNYVANNPGIATTEWFLTPCDPTSPLALDQGAGNYESGQWLKGCSDAWHQAQTTNISRK